jgi:hypothetical protein
MLSIKTNLNNNNCFTHIYYFIFPLLLSISYSNAVATSIIKTGTPTACYIHKANTITIGKTALNNNPQTIYATATYPAVLIVNSNLSTVPTINKINFIADVYGALTTASTTFSNTAVEITNTNNINIAAGIEINLGCTIKGSTAIDI